MDVTELGAVRADDDEVQVFFVRFSEFCDRFTRECLHLKAQLTSCADGSWRGYRREHEAARFDGDAVRGALFRLRLVRTLARIMLVHFASIRPPCNNTVWNDGSGGRESTAESHC
ncbi:hypothetical protein GCM10009786_14060 [Leucobacter alluvii]|uniref:Uncharacterized protein n=1 Tax=Leucobacter alluvii TaxID=340321 RepID=A0ABN3B6U9_9MICO